MKLSIVDLGTVAPGTTETDALADALETARHAEAAGFHRVWFAEHHLSRSGASHHPELLIAAAAMVTSRIRLGSGAVLMNHYSPFKVAEMFQQLEALAPGRIDLGMGRATAGPVIDAALRHDRQHPAQVEHEQQVLETLAWLHEAFPADHPFADHPLMPSVPGRPQTWLLGSSSNGSNLAAGLGIGYTFAAFINPPVRPPRSSTTARRSSPGTSDSNPRGRSSRSTSPSARRRPRACTWRIPPRASTPGSGGPGGAPVRSWCRPPTRRPPSSPRSSAPSRPRSSTAGGRGSSPAGPARSGRPSNGWPVIPVPTRS